MFLTSDVSRLQEVVRREGNEVISVASEDTNLKNVFFLQAKKCKQAVLFCTCANFKHTSDGGEKQSDFPLAFGTFKNAEY